MKQALSIAGLISLGFMLTGCAPDKPKTDLAQPLDHFNSVVLSGTTNATVKSDQTENYVRSAAKNDVNVVQKGNVLYVDSSSNHASDVDIDIQHSKTPLNLVLSGNSHITMEGDFLIQRIDASGNSQLKITWLNTSNLTVNASGNAKVFLAGVVTHLNVNASNSAEVNGKYLRVEDSYVLATGNSSVGVDVKNALGTQSKNSATVYYYRDPAFGGVYLKDKGSALRMKGLSTSSNNLLN